MCFGGPPVCCAVSLTFLTYFIEAFPTCSGPYSRPCHSHLSRTWRKRKAGLREGRELFWGCIGAELRTCPQSSKWSSKFSPVPPCPGSPASEGSVRLKWADIRAESRLRDHFIWPFLIPLEAVTWRRQWALSGFHSKSFQVPCKVLGAREHRAQK